MSIEILSALHGIAPRSDSLHRLAAAYGRGRATPEEFHAQVATEAIEWKTFQHEAGIDLPAEPRLDWLDHWRPIVKATEGFAPDIDDGTIVRWPGQNRFRRQPVLEDKLVFQPDRFHYGSSTTPNVDLITPTTFSDLVDAPGWSQSEKAEQINELYRQILGHFLGLGVKRVLLVDYLDPKKHQSPGHSIFGLQHEFPELDISYIVQGDRSTSFERANGVTETWRPIIRATTIEPDRLTPLPRPQTEAPKRLVFTHDADFERLPRKYAVEKVKQLGEYALQTRAQIARQS